MEKNFVSGKRNVRVEIWPYAKTMYGSNIPVFYVANLHSNHQVILAMLSDVKIIGHINFVLGET